jgi:hypothetical protein
MDICVWTQTEEEHTRWEASCGKVFIIEDGTPEENEMKFCTFCGKPIKEHLYYQ